LLVLSAGAGGSLVALAAGLQKPLFGLLVTAAALGGLAFLLHRGPSRPVGLSWAWCGGITFALLLSAVHGILPGYAHKFSLRAQVRPQQDLGVDPAVPVVCYPHRWDSVSFYLRRDDVRVYTTDQRQHLIADLRSRPSTLVFVKSDDGHSQALHDLLRALPASLEFVPRSRHGIVTAGVVQRRSEAPATVIARR
jgi:hypothetical protein